MAIIVNLLSVLCLGYAKGANDDFKGVATLIGRGMPNDRRALTWATPQANWRRIGKIFAAWDTELHLGAALGACAFLMIRSI